MNVMAMLGSDDVDLVLRLLQENDWDEAQAVNAHYAQQVQNQSRPN